MEKLTALWGQFLLIVIVSAGLSGLIVFIGNVLCGQSWSFTTIAQYIFWAIVVIDIFIAIGNGLSEN